MGAPEPQIGRVFEVHGVVTEFDNFVEGLLGGLG